MSNIELFKNAFEVTFPAEVASMVLDRISELFGTEFSKKYAGYADQELCQLTCTVLNGLAPKDISRGLQRLNSEEWCPSLPKFRSLCEQGGDWWTSDMAWAKAMQFESDPTVKITALTKRSLDEVRHILTNEGQKSAHFAFKDIYHDYLRRAKEQGRVQEFWVKPKEPKALGFDEAQRSVIPCPIDLVQRLKGVNSLKGVGGQA